MTYSAATQIMCLGKGPGAHVDVTLAEVTGIESIAHALDKLSNWDSPPDPHALASFANVRLRGLRRDAETPQSFSPSCSSYQIQLDPRDTGLAAAFALASSLVLQDPTIGWSEVYRWRLAAELLVPAWALEVCGADRLLARHPHAPRWLVRQRLAATLDALGEK